SGRRAERYDLGGDLRRRWNDVEERIARSPRRLARGDIDRILARLRDDLAGVDAKLLHSGPDISRQYGAPGVHGCRTGAHRQRRANLTRKSATPRPRREVICRGSESKAESAQ